MNLNYKSILIKVIFTLFSIALMFFNVNLSTAKILSLYILALNLFSIFACRKNIGMLIINAFILWLNYSIFVMNFYSYSGDFFTGFHDDKSMIPMINIMLLFTTIITFYAPKFNSKMNFSFNDNSDKKTSIIVSTGAIISLAIILLYTYSSNIQNDGRLEISSIFEYSIIIAIVGLYFTPNNRFIKSIIIIECLLFALMNIIGGGRVTALQMLIALYLIFLSSKLKLIYVIPILIICLVMFTIVGIYRENAVFGFEAIGEAFTSLFKSKFALDTSVSSFYTSVTFYKVSEVSTLETRLSLFKNFLLSMPLGGTLVPNSNLANYTRNFYTHYYGGVYPYFGYFYLGYFGVVLSAFYVVFIERLFLKIEKNGLIKCICIYIICSTPRWYLYSPSPIIRGVFLVAIIYGLCKLIVEIPVKSTDVSLFKVRNN